MPSHVYHPARTPAKLWDRLLVHPLDNPIAVLALFYGVRLILAALFPEAGAYAQFLYTPTWVDIFVGTLLLSGGVLSLTGLHWQGKEVSRGLIIERVGWMFIGGGAGAYVFGFASFPWGMITPTLLGIGALLKVISLWAIEKQTREVLWKWTSRSKGE